MLSNEPISGYHAAGPKHPDTYLCRCVDAKGKPSPGMTFLGDCWRCGRPPERPPAWQRRP